MSKITLRQLTDTSWVVQCPTSENGRLGILAKTTNGYYLSGTKGKTELKTKEDVTAFFGLDVFEHIVKPKEEKGTLSSVNGYPTKLNIEVFQVKSKTNLPLFTKREGSEVYYSAGYYAVKFATGWVTAFCPKFTTLETSKYVGPFKTEVEAKDHIRLATSRNE